MEVGKLKPLAKIRGNRVHDSAQRCSGRCSGHGRIPMATVDGIQNSLLYLPLYGLFRPKK